LVLLQTIHEFAEELLDGLPDASVRRRHAEHFADLAETAEPWLTGGRQLEWLTRLSSEHDNLRAALAWSSGQDGDGRLALRLAAALWHFWEMSGSLTEGRRWLEAVIARGDVHAPRLRLQAITGAATMAWSVGDHDRATQLHQEALDLARGLGDKSAEAFSLNALGAQLVDDENYDAAEHLLDQARALAMKLGELRTAGMATHNTAEIQFHRGRYAEAAIGYRESLQIFRDLDDRWAVASTLHGLAVAVLRQGDREQAAEALRDSLRLAVDVGENYSLADGLEGLALVAVDSEQPVRAARLLAAADAIRRRIGAPLQGAYRGDYESLLDLLRGQLRADAFERAWAEGQRLSVAQSVEEASRV
jgi:tetratricopeptide (TPR) repeat protein